MRLADLCRIEATRDRRNWNREVKEPVGFEQIVARFQAPYADETRREWIRRALKVWKERVAR